MLQYRLSANRVTRRLALTIAGTLALLAVSPAVPAHAAGTPAPGASVSASAAIQDKTAGLSLRGIKLGDGVARVTAKLGSPDRKDTSEYGLQWFVYNADYTKFAMIGIRNGVVAGLYSNAKAWTTSSGTALALATADAWKQAGSTAPLPAPDYASSVSFTKSSRKVTLFTDRLAQGKLAGLLVTDVRAAAAAEQADKSRPELLAAYEREMLDLVNAARVRLALKPFAWDGKASASARLHSADMAVNNYFDHRDLQGLSPFDRMANAGIRYGRAAENIAAGYANALYAHSGWLNSKGHRVNLLNPKLTRLGAGAASGGSYGLYYTQNFYTPLA